MGNYCCGNPIEQIENIDNLLPFIIDKFEVNEKKNEKKDEQNESKKKVMLL